MEIVSIERKTFEAMVAKFDRFVSRMDAICHRHGEKKMSEWMHSIGSTDTQSELLHSEINPTGGGFLCPQRHSKIYFQLPE